MKLLCVTCRPKTRRLPLPTPFLTPPPCHIDRKPLAAATDVFIWFASQSLHVRKFIREFMVLGNRLDYLLRPE